VFPEGRLEILWEGEVTCLVRVEIESESEKDSESRVWVLTVIAERFVDGVFAWQIHFDASRSSVLVIPNDFLTSRLFSLSQLGITASSESTGQLALSVPRNRLIPNLIAPGDRLQVHALWVQQEPLVSFVVPPFQGEAIVVGPAGEGGGAGASTLAATGDCLPAQAAFLQGEPIEHRFVVVDEVSGAIDVLAHASCALLRSDGGESGEVLAYEILVCDETGVFALRIDTTGLPSGEYELLVWTSASTDAYRKRLEIIQPEEPSQRSGDG